MCVGGGGTTQEPSTQQPQDLGMCSGKESLELRHSAICNLTQWPLWVFQRPQQAWLSQEGRKVWSPLLKETANMAVAENMGSLLWATLINHDSAGDYIHSSVAKKKKTLPKPSPRRNGFSVRFFDRVLCYPPSPILFLEK